MELTEAGKLFLSAKLLNSLPLDAADSVRGEGRGLSTSSLLFENLRTSAAFDCKGNGIVLPATPTSFLESATGSDLKLVLGTITGIISDLLTSGTLAVVWDFKEVLFWAVVLRTVVEPPVTVFGPEFKLILWGVLGALPVASCNP